MATDLILQRERIARIEEDLKVILSPLAVPLDFDNLWRRMEFACRLEDVASVAAQVFFSMAMYTGAWAQAMERYWYDPLTGDHYDSQDDAPDDVRLRLQWRELRRWDTQEQFVQYAKQFRPRSTLWHRHTCLMAKIALWKNATKNYGDDVDIPIEVFYEFARGVVLAPAITEVIKRDVIRVKPIDGEFEVVNENAVSRMMPDGVLPPKDHPDYKSEVATAILSTISDLENTAKTSRVSTANVLLKTDFLGEADVRAWLASVEDGDCIRLQVTYPPDDDGGLLPVEFYKILIVRDTGEIVPYSNLGKAVRGWVDRRIGFRRTT